MESLCRELQKQNKSIKEESLARIREEEEKRKETQAKFQKSLNEIQKMMNENTEKNNKLKEDNLEMTSKFKHILEQYELREQQMDKISKQMELVTQLNDAKIAKVKVELAAEREKFTKETAIYEDTIKILKHQLIESRTAEKLLKEQVELYSGKYGEFQESLKKSHDVFEGYKTDMTKMSKKNIKMEQEVLLWKKKCEKTNAILLNLATEKQVRDEHITKTAKQMYHLQKLCRQLQFERTAFLNALKENNVEIPAVPEAPKDIKIDLPVEPIPVEAPVPDNKLDLMTKDCDELKKNLAQLQGKLESIASAECEETAAAVPEKTPNKKDKPRNRKGKKDKSNKKIEENTNGNSVVIDETTKCAENGTTASNVVEDEKCATEEQVVDNKQLDETKATEEPLVVAIADPSKTETVDVVTSPESPQEIVNVEKSPST